MKRLMTVCVGFAAVSAFAMHLQIGFSGYSHEIAAAQSAGTLISPSSPWFSATTEIGATPSRIGRDYNFENGTFGEMLTVRIETTSSSGPVGITPTWSNPGSPFLLTYYNNAAFTIDEIVPLPTFGYSRLPYTDRRISHGLITVRGDPYSIVWNDTGSARTINGERFAAGESKSLLCPIHLVMAEIPGVHFYDISSGVEIVPYDYDEYGESVKYYNDGGYYTLSWSGDIQITDGTATPTNTPDETLIFGDMVSANVDRILYATNNMPIRNAIVSVTTNVMLQTWWDFDHSVWGDGPKAMINGEVVCPSHSTTHIIAYTVNANNLKVNEFTGIGHVYFTMSQTPASGYSGGSCTMRCWDVAMGSSTSAYANTPTEHKAEVSAGTGTARFEITINIYAGTWKVEPN